MIEGSGVGAGSVLRTNGSGSGRPKNIRIRIPNTVRYHHLPAPTGPSCCTFVTETPFCGSSGLTFGRSCRQLLTDSCCLGLLQPKAPCWSSCEMRKSVPGCKQLSLMPCRSGDSFCSGKPGCKQLLSLMPCRSGDSCCSGTSGCEQLSFSRGSCSGTDNGFLTRQS